MHIESDTSKLQVTESHQSTKLDTSGTAKAVISSFKKLGLNFDLDQVRVFIMFLYYYYNLIMMFS